MDLPLPLKRKQVSSSAMENLPSHILMEIISRLPIKAVMTIRCVSKSLLSLVSDASFKEMYSTRAPTELLFRSRVEDSGHAWADPRGYQSLRECSSSTTLYIANPVFLDDSSTVIDMKINVMLDLQLFSVRANNTLNFKSTQTKLTLVNSCNGLVCYIGPDTNRFAVIVNPVTGEYITIPGPKSLEGKDTSYGLGFSPKDNKFKLLRLLWLQSPDFERRIIMTSEIYTFDESGSWKSVANFPNVYPPRNATFREGVLYWHCISSIVTFDFDSEQFGKRFALPRLYHLHTGVLGGCLYTTGRNGDGVVETWVMREYGRGSWTKLFSMEKGVDCSSGANEPIKYLPCGKILMRIDHNEIVCYNPYTRRGTFIGYFSSGCEAISIRPSLVSLKVMLGDRCVHTKVANPEVAKFCHWWTRSRQLTEFSERMKKTCGNKGKEIVKPITEELQASQAGSSKRLEASVWSPIPVQSEVDVIEGVVGQGAGTEARDSRNQSMLDSEKRHGTTLTCTVCEECMQQVEVIKRKMEHLEEEGRQWREEQLHRDAQRDIQMQHLLALLQGTQGILPPAAAPPFPDDAPHFDNVK